MLIQFQTVARFEKGSHVKNEMTASMAFFNGLRFFCERLAGGVQSMSSKVSLLQHSKFSWECVSIWHAGSYNMTHMISVCDSTNPTHCSKKATISIFESIFEQCVGSVESQTDIVCVVVEKPACYVRIFQGAKSWHFLWRHWNMAKEISLHLRWIHVNHQ